jgi:hypothetical protein
VRTKLRESHTTEMSEFNNNNDEYYELSLSNSNGNNFPTQKSGSSVDPDGLSAKFNNINFNNPYSVNITGKLK